MFGDYPAVDGTWEVDSVGLTGLLAGLNAGRDSNGLALSARTSFCIGARVNPGARDPEAEIARAHAKVRAGAQFLISRPVYEVDSLARLVDALDGTGVPLLLSVAPLRSFEEADYLANEVPGVMIPGSVLAALEQAGRSGGPGGRAGAGRRPAGQGTPAGARRAAHRPRRRPGGDPAAPYLDQLADKHRRIRLRAGVNTGISTGIVHAHGVEPQPA